MATKTAWFLEHGVPLLRNLPDGTFFDTKPNGLEFQARTLQDVHVITQAFPGTIWSKRWRKDLSWWEYSTTLLNGIALKIYAIREAPKKCEAIFQKRLVKKEIPLTFRTEEVEEDVLVGWDCGEEGTRGEGAA
mgnify:CR=1 FL=1